MLDSQLAAVVFLFALVMVVTPGPNNIMLMASGLNYGARKTVPHAFGVILGVPLMTLAIGFGLGKVFALMPVLHQIVKVVGIVYLLYLAWGIATTKGNMSNSNKGELKNPNKPLSLLQALLFQWVNPKAWVMVIGAVSTYTSNNINVEIVLIALCFFFAAFFSTSLWTLCGALLNKVLTTPRYRVLFNRAMGILLALSILPMIGA